MSREQRHSIDALPRQARAVAAGVRARWGMQNLLHWVLDVTFREDDSRVRGDHAPANLATSVSSP